MKSLLLYYIGILLLLPCLALAQNKGRDTATNTSRVHKSVSTQALRQNGTAIPASQLHDLTSLQPQVVVRRINIEGAERTRRRILLREMSIHEGDTLRTDSLSKLAEQNRLRLYNLELFTEVSVNVVPVDPGTVDYHVA